MNRSLRRDARRGWWLAWGLSLGCAANGSGPTGSVVPPQVESPSADELFAAGRFPAAVVAYSEAIARETNPSEIARLHLFRALSLRGRGSERLAYESLRALEHEYGSTIWGRLARLFVDEFTRQQALRDTLVSVGAQLRGVQRQLEAVESEWAVAREHSEEQRTELLVLKEERKRLTRELDEAQVEARGQSTRILELEQELAALKQIDMQRQP